MDVTLSLKLVRFAFELDQSDEAGQRTTYTIGSVSDVSCHQAVTGMHVSGTTPHMQHSSCRTTTPPPSLITCRTDNESVDRRHVIEMLTEGFNHLLAR
jgi:hypothetical protein